MSTPKSLLGQVRFEENRRNPDYWDNPPEDYEECGDCGFDHSYEPEEARRFHLEHGFCYVGRE